MAGEPRLGRESRPRDRSLVDRVAWSAAIAASTAALLAAFATSALADWLVRRAEDRRLVEAAVTFAVELGEVSRDMKNVAAVHRDESEEMTHTAMVFAVYDQGRHLVGDPRLSLPHAGCETEQGQTLRVCRAEAPNGLTAVVGAVHGGTSPLLWGAALSSGVVAATVAWLASRPVSRLAVAPLSRLRDRIARMEVDALSRATLGPPEGVTEVDALRDTLCQLVARVDESLSHSQRFAANAAHELRTPLAAVRTQLELVSEAELADGPRDDVARARARLAELAELVERLLVLTSPSDRRRELVSLRDVVEDAVTTLAPAERARVELGPGDATVLGDGVLLGTLAANAIGNALKFGTRARATVERDGDTVVLLVDDDGPGVAAADRERVFEPFVRSGSAARLPGHGLGLALIRHVARMHGGEASLLAGPLGGARLAVRLPRHG